MTGYCLFLAVRRSPTKQSPRATRARLAGSGTAAGAAERKTPEPEVKVTPDGRSNEKVPVLERSSVVGAVLNRNSRRPSETEGFCPVTRIEPLNKSLVRDAAVKEAVWHPEVESKGPDVPTVSWVNTQPPKLDWKKISPDAPTLSVP